MDDRNPGTNGKPSKPSSEPNSKRSTPAPNTPTQYLRNNLKNIQSPLTDRTAKSTPNSPSFSRVAKSAQNSPVVHSHYSDGQLNQLNAIKTSETAPPSPSLNINRVAYHVKDFNTKFLPIEKEPITTTQQIKKFRPDFSKRAWIARIKSLFPILVWLPQYDYRQNLLVDIIVGITIASFQVPQSMGYALIANVNPVYGLYTAFFPSLLYTFLGTSRHCAVGPVAIVAGLMTGNIVVEVMHDLKMDYKQKQGIGDRAFDTALNSTSDIPIGFEDVTNIDIANMVALLNGVYIFILGCLRLGFISNYLSEEMVSGFMTSAAIYVFTTQIHYLTGVHVENETGPLALIYTWIEFFTKIKEVNLTVLIIALICVAILIFFKLVVEKQLHKYNIKLPFPIHLFIMIGGIIASNLINLETKYQVQVVGNIPNKFAMPALPKLKLFKYLWSRCIPTAVVAYTTTLSVGKMYATKHNYKVDPNQEMIALGACNIWASMWSCIPSAASIPRSQVQESGGGRTQFVSLVNCLCILVVILALSTLLHDLPSSVLAACIAVALASIVSKIQEFLRFWWISKLDGAIWIVTFLGVMILNVDFGIYLGFGCSLLLLIYKSQRPKTYSLGSVDNSDIYVPLSKFKRAKEIEGVKIYQFCGPLNFANVEYFRQELQTRSGVDVNLIKEKMDALRPKTSCFIFGSTKSYEMDQIEIENKDILPTHIIIDCSMLSYIDTTGVRTLKNTIQKHGEINITTLLTGCQVHIESMLKKEEFFKEVSSDRVLKSVHDAVTYIKTGFSYSYMPGMDGSDLKPDHFSPRLLSTISLDMNENLDEIKRNHDGKNQELNDFSNGSVKSKNIFGLRRKVTPLKTFEMDKTSTDSDSSTP